MPRHPVEHWEAATHCGVAFRELDLLRLLRSGRAGIRQSESQKRREQCMQARIEKEDYAMSLVRNSCGVLSVQEQNWNLRPAD
jgi:hypothetical protein